MKLICFGYGYSAQVLGAHLLTPKVQKKDKSKAAQNKSGDTAPGNLCILATHRALPPKPATKTPRQGTVHRRVFSRAHPLTPQDLAGATHALVSIPPDDQGDPVIDCHGEDLAGLDWVGYLSTTGVYGDRGGAWVDEDSPCLPTGHRGKQRLAAERAWLDLGRAHNVPVHIFRLPGIYGPGRNACESLRRGKAQRIIKPGQVFSRIHVDDIARALIASMNRPQPGTIYNVCDNTPAPPQDVVLFASRLLNMTPPVAIPFAQAQLTPMAASFYRDSKRVRNNRIRRMLGFTPTYKNYRAGLRAILSDET